MRRSPPKASQQIERDRDWPCALLEFQCSLTAQASFCRATSAASTILRRSQRDEPPVPTPLRPTRRPRAPAGVKVATPEAGNPSNSTGTSPTQGGKQVDTGSKEAPDRARQTRTLSWAGKRRRTWTTPGDGARPERRGSGYRGCWATPTSRR